MSDVKTRHPEYTSARVAEWALMRDAVAGESAIKAAGERYLPLPSGFKSQADAGAAAYASYKDRAQFPEILAPTIFALIGIAHGKEIGIEMPESMMRLTENADGKGLPLEAFHRRITRQILVAGRYGVLVDAPEGGGDPVLAGYEAENIINWDDQFFVLDESGKVRNGFDWDDLDQQRVLMLEDGRYVQKVYVDGDLTSTLLPITRGEKAIGAVPFTVASAVDVSGVLHTPPLIGVARAAKAIYQLSADYRHQLYMSGQETLVAINGPAPSAVGAGVVHSMTGSEGVVPDLKYVSPTCSGIDAHLKAIEDNRTAAIQAGARLLEQSNAVQESGSARQLRFASETATLTSIVQTSCALLERALRDVAMLEGLNENEVIVTPPKDLLANTMTPTEFAALFGTYQSGAMSWDTFYQKGQEGGIYSPERTAEEEYALIEGQGEALTGAPGNTSP